jgi:hypothetical protein
LTFGSAFDWQLHKVQYDVGYSPVPYRLWERAVTGSGPHRDKISICKGDFTMLGTQTQRNGFSWLGQITGPQYRYLLWIFMVIVLGHWLEHLTQLYQVYVMGWLPKEAGGALGFWFPNTNRSEVLHFTYNLLLWGGIILLRPGMQGGARRWWNAALIAQSWHFFEHLLLQVQWLTGYYLFGASKQISILELWFPRMELHFAYNLIVFVPLIIGVFAYFRHDVDHRPPSASFDGSRSKVGR